MLRLGELHRLVPVGRFHDPIAAHLQQPPHHKAVIFRVLNQQNRHLFIVPGHCFGAPRIRQNRVFQDLLSSHKLLILLYH